MAGGSLGTEDFKLIMELITLINLKKDDKKFFDIIVFTKDTHPVGHKSFGKYGNHCRPYCSIHKHCFNGCQYMSEDPDKQTRCRRKKPTQESDFGKNKISIKDMLDMYEYSIDKNVNKETFDRIEQIKKNIDKNTIDAIVDTVKKIRGFMLKELNEKFKKGLGIPEKETIEKMREIISSHEFFGEKYYDEKIYGNDLSYLYKIAAISDKYKIPNINKPNVILTAKKNTDDTENMFDPPVRQNVNPILIYDNKTIKLTDTNVFEDIVNNIKNKYENKQIIIEMEKGMICDMDANSAFVYHADYEGVTPTDFPKELPTKVENSTGLLELLTKIGGNELNIYNCGLVGNICVIQSAIHGAALTKLLKEKDDTTDIQHQIKYMSCFGTRFLTIIPPKVAEPDRNVAMGVYQENLFKLNSLNQNQYSSDKYIIDDTVLKMVHIENGSIHEHDELQHLIYSTPQGGHDGLYHKYMKYKSKYHHLKTNN